MSKNINPPNVWRINRRNFLKKSVIASAGAAVALSLEEKALLGDVEKPGMSLPSDSVKGLPAGKIGNVQISRLICGGNLISGWTHSRDLIYVSSLSKAYNTAQKVMETLQICEENGVNTIISGDVRILSKYWKERGGQMQWIAQVGPKEDDLTSNIKRAIDDKAVGVYIHGGTADKWVKNGRADLLEKCVLFIKENGLIAGIGGHSVEVPIACEKAKIKVDFYMQTLHDGNYWSATPKEKRVEWSVDSFGPDDHDNIWCLLPERVIEFMKKVDKPWIAFKVLAAGAIHPQDGFKYAFENGADFICVGMFDFQVREDIIIARDILSGKLNRQRQWMA